MRSLQKNQYSDRFTSPEITAKQKIMDINMKMTKEEQDLEKRIEAAKKKVEKYSEPYNKALEELYELQEQRLRSEEERIVEAYRKSTRTIEEVLDYLEGHDYSDGIDFSKFSFD